MPLVKLRPVCIARLLFRLTPAGLLITKFKRFVPERFVVQLPLPEIVCAAVPTILIVEPKAVLLMAPLLVILPYTDRVCPASVSVPLLIVKLLILIAVERPGRLVAETIVALSVEV